MQGPGKRGPGVGGRGPGARGRGPGARGRGPGVGGQGTGVGGQGTGARGQGHGLRSEPRRFCEPRAFASRLLPSRDRKGAVALLILTVFLAACSHTSTHAAGKRLIVLGVDGMDPVFLEAHWSSLPNLNRLRGAGDFRRLATTIPPQSPVAWSTVTTGMDPGGHGIYDFVHRDPATRLPKQSMTEITEATRTFGIGPYLFPLSGGGIRQTRAGRAFWQILAEHGIASNIVRMPANFPPAECESESLAGMGTPDLTGTNGTFLFFTDDPAETRTTVAAGKIVAVKIQNGRAVLPIEGPPNSLRKDHATTLVDLVVHPDPVNPVARFDLTGGEQQLVLKQGEWSDWLHADFHLIAFKGAPGIFRLYLQQVHPYLRVYVSPVNIDPEDPALPISTPAAYSRSLDQKLGPFYTQGIAEETAAYRAGLLSRAEFLQQSHKILADSLRMFHYQLERFRDGLLFYYFSSVDQNAHMLWAKHDDELLEIYKGVDTAIGEAMRAADNGASLMVISDHGFARFDRQVHLNKFLMDAGYLTLDDPANTGDDEVFVHVDWGKTQAYAIGLNAIYLNLEGRENGGIVSGFDKQTVLDEISRKLLAFKDPATGENVVDKVYFSDTAYQGKNLKYAPDILVGFRRGYRASWQTALGAVPKVALVDNTDAWIGDHCMASDEVPGVLLSNRKINAAAPQLADITATILHEFGLPVASGMIGQSVF
jgi:predicted AlkP superfamily phosphohydrolase/phosphomutase